MKWNVGLMMSTFLWITNDIKLRTFLYKYRVISLKWNECENNTFACLIKSSLEKLVFCLNYIHISIQYMSVELYRINSWQKVHVLQHALCKVIFVIEKCKMSDFSVLIILNICMLSYSKLQQVLCKVILQYLFLKNARWAWWYDNPKR